MAKYGGGMSTTDVVLQVWVDMSSIWMHRRDRVGSLKYLVATMHIILMDVASGEWQFWWRLSMLLVCQLPLSSYKFELICYRYGCIDEVGWADWSIWSLYESMVVSRVEVIVVVKSLWFVRKLFHFGECVSDTPKSTLSVLFCFRLATKNNRPSGPPGSAVDWRASQAPPSI
jgi:hypothetical protein